MRERQLCNEHIYYFGGLLYSHLSSLSWLDLLAGGLRSRGSLCEIQHKYNSEKSRGVSLVSTWKVEVVVMKVGVVKVGNGGEEPLRDPHGRWEKIHMAIIFNFIYLF